MNIAPNSFIKVENGIPVGDTFTLPQNYVRDNGDVVLDVSLLTTEEKIAIGLYPVVEILPESFDARYQTAVQVCTVGADHVSVSYSVADIDLNAVKQRRIAEVYAKAKQIIDGYSEGYAIAEVATFPALQAEIAAYNADNAQIGAMMQSVIARGKHTAQTLSALLTPRMATQAATLQTRDDHVTTIMGLTTHQEVADYDVLVGW